MKLLKRISFALLGFTLFVLTIATVLEKICGTDFVSAHIYGSVTFVVLWAVTALAGFTYLLQCRLQKQFSTFLLHLSFLVILAGAFITWLYGEQGTLHLRKGENVSVYTDKEGREQTFPFQVSLEDFRVVYYTGTRAPMDYVSELTVIDRADSPELVRGEVAMNHIFSYKNYRFYQSGYDEDSEGTILAISYDPYGIIITYTGYALLLLSMILFFFNPRSQFRQLLKSASLRRTTALCLILFASAGGMQAASSKEVPKVLPREVAARFGNLHVLYNDRICPLQTVAKDFTVKLYGRSTYRGLTPEQVLTGWMFYYSSWKIQPVIKIKSAAARDILGISGKYASLEDYANELNEYEFDVAKCRMQSGEAIPDKRGLEEADEKYNIVMMLCSGKMLKLYPHRQSEDHLLEWYSQGDMLPRDMDNDKWYFIRKSMDYANEMVVTKDYEGVLHLLDKLEKYQQKEASGALPSTLRFNAEKLYNRIDYTLLLAVSCILVGLFAFAYYCRQMIYGCSSGRMVRVILNILLVVVLLYLTVAITLRGYIGNHFPLSNGFETMQFMAFCALLLTAFLQRHFRMLLPFGFLLCGFCLLVSMLGEANPRITQLMPVLASPLLCIHVMVIMIAYALLGFAMLNGVTAIVLHASHRDCKSQIEQLCTISRLLLYPAVFLLGAGIFIGAVWANVSWGRYWGWDPKEVWALITMLVYALALHSVSLPWFRKPIFFHIFTVVAFLSVLITYFGVNFLLGGMHSYAAG